MYHGVANLSDGTTVEANGTISELAAWADGIVRESAGEISIEIREVAA